jgi:hypothetical protein
MGFVCEDQPLVRAAALEWIFTSRCALARAKDQAKNLQYWFSGYEPSHRLWIMMSVSQLVEDISTDLKFVVTTSSSSRKYIRRHIAAGGGRRSRTLARFRLIQKHIRKILRLGKSCVDDELRSPRTTLLSTACLIVEAIRDIIREVEGIHDWAESLESQLAEDQLTQ